MHDCKRSGGAAEMQRSATVGRDNEPAERRADRPRVGAMAVRGDAVRGALLQRLPTAESDRDREQNQAATWNSSAMKLAWARMSRPPTSRTCPFLIIAIAS